MTTRDKIAFKQKGIEEIYDKIRKVLLVGSYSDANYVAATKYSFVTIEAVM